MGCTDPQAANFDVDATINDGSCMYLTTSYTLPFLASLPSQLEETSGLAFALNRLWSHNDGGNTDQIFELDSLTGEVLQTINLNNAPNIDWEDLAEDETYLYIGDFGNNAGDRMNLRIHRLRKDDLSNTAVDAELIEFSFSDQTVFTPNQNNHNYDCEAFFAHNDSLHLFSKNWADGQTRHYVMPNTPGQHIAQLRDSFAVGGLITAADIDEEGHVLLLGYLGLSNFMWLLFDYPETRFFDGNKRKIDLGSSLNNGQTEGLVFNANGEGYISSEGVSLISLAPRLYRFSIRQWTEPIVSSLAGLEVTGLQLYPNPIESHFYMKGGTGATHLQYWDMTGRLLHQETAVDLSDVIAWPETLPGGWYLILGQGEDKPLFRARVYKR